MKYRGKTTMNSNAFSKIVFERSGRGHGDTPTGIFSINPDGSDCRWLRRTGRGVQWSPDGNWIAFHDEPLRDYRDPAFVSSLLSRDLARFCTPDMAVRSAGEPNHEYNPGSYPEFSNVYVCRPDGSELRKITNNNTSAGFPTWSPDSSTLAYCVQPEVLSNSQIWTVELASGERRQITAENNDFDLVWAPNNKLYFRRLLMSGTQRMSPVFESNPDGTDLKPSSLFQHGDTEPSWTRDGSRIAFKRRGDLSIINQDGSDFLGVDLGELVPFQFSWSPSGDMIAFTSRLDSNGGAVFLLHIRTMAIEQLTVSPNPDAETMDVSWSPALDANQNALANKPDILMNNPQEVGRPSPSAPSSGGEVSPAGTSLSDKYELARVSLSEDRADVAIRLFEDMLQYEPQMTDAEKAMTRGFLILSILQKEDPGGAVIQTMKKLEIRRPDLVDLIIKHYEAMPAPGSWGQGIHFCGIKKEALSGDLLTAFKVSKALTAYSLAKWSRDTLQKDQGKENAKDKRCFVATATYGSENADAVALLREYRDNILMPSGLGKSIVRTYYRLSPPLANLIARHRLLRTVSRYILVGPATIIAKRVLSAREPGKHGG